MFFVKEFPIRYYLVNLPLPVALNITQQFLESRGFKVDGRNLTGALERQGFAAQGWQGLVLRKGNLMGELVGNDVLGWIPRREKIPGVKHVHGKILVSILAKPAAQGATELWLGFVDRNAAEDTRMTDRQVYAIFDEFPTELGKQGVQVGAHEGYGTYDLPKGHPLSPITWTKLSVSAKWK